MAEEISFIGRSEYCCLCFIDIVESTRITTVEITHPKNIKRYYSIFINTMAAIIRDFNATIIKNTEIVWYTIFQKTIGPLANTVSDFKNVFDCGLTMISVNPIINTRLKEEGLPNLYYRISADCGRVEVAKSLTSTHERFISWGDAESSKWYLWTSNRGLVKSILITRLLKLY